jgi:hypothetical protein
MKKKGHTYIVIVQLVKMAIRQYTIKVIMHSIMLKLCKAVSKKTAASKHLEK